MFSALHQGSTLYILEKGQNPSLKVGQVVSVSQPKSDPAIYNPSNIFNQPTFVDVTASVDGTNMEFKKLNSINSTASDPGTGIFISESREAMSSEVEALYRASKSVLDSVPYHENAIAIFDNMIKELNPSLAKQKQMDVDIANMKSRQDAMDSKLDKILNAVINKNI